MPVDIYQDVLLWSEQQAALLRHLAAGERVNAETDWAAVIEEVEDVGKSELRACESNLRQALTHLLKLTYLSGGPATHRRGEIAAFLTEAQACFSPSMRQKIDLEKLYRQARYQVELAAGPGELTGTLPDECPLTSTELQQDSVEVEKLEKRFSSARP